MEWVSELFHAHLIDNITLECANMMQRCSSLHSPLKAAIAYVLFLSAGATSSVLADLDGVVISTRKIKSLDGSRRIRALNLNVCSEPIDVAATGNLAGDSDVLPLDGDRRGTGGFGNLEGLEANGSTGFYGFHRRPELVVGIDSRDTGLECYRDLSGAGSGRCCPGDTPSQQEHDDGTRGEAHLYLTNSINK